MFARHLVALLLIVCADGALAATYTVTNITTGAGSLRQAIADANANPGADVIEFNILGRGPYIIYDSGLVATEEVVIDGYTAAGTSPNTGSTNQPFDANIQVILSGENQASGDLLTLQGTGSTVQGMAFIDAVGGAGISLEGGGFHRVYGCMIGLRPNSFDATDRSNANGGVRALSNSNRIGDDDPSERNVISTNASAQVWIQGNLNVVRGNVIGLLPDGVTVPLGNQSSGIGVVIIGDDNTVGGTAGSRRNVITGNDGHGLFIQGDSNVVRRNWIGLDNVNGAAPGNGGSGVLISSGSGNEIGPLNGATRNRIGGNAQHGIAVNSPATDTIIRGNWIGIGPNDLALGNGSWGIRCDGSDTEIGGTESAHGNTIAYNGAGGIQTNTFTTGVSIRGNRIRDNDDATGSGLGIDLKLGGVDLNDTPDIDGVQNFPVFDKVVSAAPNWEIDGHLQSQPSTTYTIELFESDGYDPSGYGEGGLFLESFDVTTDAGGLATFSRSVAATLTGPTFSATATGPSGETSEFSPSAAFLLVDTTADSGPGSWHQAVLDANALPETDVIAFDLPSGADIPVTSISSTEVVGPVTIDGWVHGTPNSNPFGQALDAVYAASIQNLVTLSGSRACVRGVWFEGHPLLPTSVPLTLAGDGEHLLQGVGVGACEQNFGISVQSSFNVIGGSDPADRCELLYAESVQVEFHGNDNLLQGSVLGLPRDGIRTVWPCLTSATGVRVRGHGNRIGGTNLGEGNVISGFSQVGIHVTSFGGGSVDDTDILGNYIGTSFDGMSAVGNLIAGIELGSTTNTLVGGTGDSGNLISGNGGDGIHIQAGIGVDVQGNTIGGDVTGLGNIPNEGAGVHISGGFDHRIGGSLSASNRIRGNDGDGIDLSFLTWSEGIEISKNRISGNGGLGIDIAPDGPNPNDVLDVDEGGPDGNRMQNYPEISNVAPVGPNHEITGQLLTEASKQYRIEFYFGGGDASGYGEGQNYLGETTVNTNVVGHANFVVSVPMIPDGVFVTAIARDIVEGDTSEFSLAYALENTGTGSNVVVSPQDLASAATPVELTFDNVTTSGVTSLEIQPTGPAAPTGFMIGDGSYYDLSSTAGFTGNVEICISYDENDIPGDEADLRLFHYDDGLVPPDWVDVTTSLDTANNVVCGETTSFSPFVLAVQDAVTATPVPMHTFTLHGAYPNPFNPRTTIRFELTESAPVQLDIYDVAGRRVRRLIGGEMLSAGQHERIWNGEDAGGRAVGSGIYYLRLVQGQRQQSRSIALVR